MRNFEKITKKDKKQLDNEALNSYNTRKLNKKAEKLARKQARQAKKELFV